MLILYTWWIYVPRTKTRDKITVITIHSSKNIINVILKLIVW